MSCGICNLLFGRHDRRNGCGCGDFDRRCDHDRDFYRDFDRINIIRNQELDRDFRRPECRCDDRNRFRCF